jgi:hypothetical protein
MSPSQSQVRENSAPVCGVGKDGLKCAVVSWVAPLAAAIVLVVGMYYPVIRAFNIIFVAFGITALIRSAAHIHRFGACGLGGHVAVGVVLNLVVVTLVAIYIFTGFDPLSIKP